MRARRRFRLGLAATIAAVLVLQASDALDPAVAARSTNGRRVAFGAYIPHSWQPRRIDLYAKLVGRMPVIVSSYKPWTEQPFVRSELDAVWSRGAVAMITWEPWDWEDHSRAFGLAAIARGRYDGYVRRAAAAAAAWGRPILLRFAHEMNGTWYPWARRPGNTPRLYVQAWRHVVQLFREAGARNVEWVWAPNVDEQAGPSVSLPLVGQGPTHPFPFERYYPGNRWVNWVGLDGFNWGKGGEWQAFTGIFGNSYDSAIRLSSRPIIVTETASNESFGDKAAWVSSALRDEIPRFPRIRGVVWFDEAFGGVAAKVNSSPGALQAFRSEIASPRYALTRRQLLATPEALPRGTDAPAPPSMGFGKPSLLERVAHKLLGPYLLPALVAVAAAVGAFAAALLIRRRRLRSRVAR